MTPSNNAPNDKASDAVRLVGDKVSETASQLKDRVSDFGRSAADTLERGRTVAASGLESTASALHQSGDKMTGLAHSTADKLTVSADYLRNHDLKAMMSDVEELVKRNPVPSLVVAGILGLFVGRSMRRIG